MLLAVFDWNKNQMLFISVFLLVQNCFFVDIGYDWKIHQAASILQSILPFDATTDNVPLNA